MHFVLLFYLHFWLSILSLYLKYAQYVSCTGTTMDALRAFFAAAPGAYIHSAQVMGLGGGRKWILFGI